MTAESDPVPISPDFSGLIAPVVVACSGGADSVALLALAAEAGLEPTAVYVDHGLRGDTEADAAAVKSGAEMLGASWRVEPVHVGHGANLEARARDARYLALRAAGEALGATAILVGHTADDQAETVLLNLLRGAGSAGLAGMARRRGIIVRPLLHLRRADVRAIARDRGLVVVEDPMNADVRWRRSWIRHDVLPLLERGASRDLVPILVRQAEVFRSESALLDQLGDELLETAGAETPQVAVLLAAPLPVCRRALRRWLGVPPPSLAEIDRVVAVASGAAVAAELAGGRAVRRSAGRLRRELP